MLRPALVVHFGFVGGRKRHAGPLTSSLGVERQDQIADGHVSGSGTGWRSGFLGIRPGPEGVSEMPKIVATHSVVDVERWLAGKSERAATLGRYSTDVTDYVSADGTSQIAITADVHDMPGLEAMLASPSADDAATMERHGVIPPVTVYLQR